MENQEDTHLHPAQVDSQFGGDLNDMAPVKNLCELRCYCECVYERVWKKGVFTISQQTFAEQFADEYR